MNLAWIRESRDQESNAKSEQEEEERKNTL